MPDREPTHGDILSEIRNVKTGVEHVAGRLDDHIKTSNAWRESFDRRLLQQTEKPPTAIESLVELLKLAAVLVALAAVVGPPGVARIAEWLSNFPH